MSLSSNTLIHFTSSKDALKGILSDNFRVKYCREDIRLNGIDVILHIPMISFCDIPLSQIKNHIASYGHYGIGLSRGWALRNRLNPVLYVQERSTLAQSYEELVVHLREVEKAGTVDVKARRMAMDIVRYIKNYEGPLNHGGAILEKYRYSDEREWRYVPDREACEMLYTAEEFEEKGKGSANEDVAPMRLMFDPDDIKYIIIHKDGEIREFVEHLRNVKGDKYSLRQVERLTTRILTSEQIHGDM
jgi:hypothetical protein